MGRLVMKFGGTSVANIDRIRNVARHVKREVDAGHDVAVVVSAMAGKTNELVEWCRDASPMHDAREYDAVVASGEQVTAGLLAIALPRIRDFRGLSDRQFDGHGNYTFGLVEQVMFHEIDPDKVDRQRGMDITVVTTATNDAEGRALLRRLGFPFREG